MGQGGGTVPFGEPCLLPEGFVSMGWRPSFPYPAHGRALMRNWVVELGRVAYHLGSTSASNWPQRIAVFPVGFGFGAMVIGAGVEKIVEMRPGPLFDSAQKRTAMAARGVAWVLRTGASNIDYSEIARELSSIGRP